MTKTWVPALTGLTMMAATALVAVPADAAATGASASVDQARGGCVSRAEFRRVRKGWSILRVRRAFGTAGKQTYYQSPSPYWPAEQWRDYRTCARYSSVSLTFKRRHGTWRVTDKTGFWL